jgi:hypothetical protein
VHCVPADRSVWLDGERIVDALEESVFDYLAVLAERYPTPITYNRIKDQVPTLPENQTRFNSKVDGLPYKFSSQIRVERKTGRGHVLKLHSD